MRFARFAFFALVLVLMSQQVWAQGANQSAAAPSAQGQGGMLVGQFDCFPPVPCEQSAADFPKTSDFVARASACVTQNMNVAQGIDIFDQSGLDGSGCLSTNPQAFPTKSRVSNIPQCCVKGFVKGMCILQCSVMAQ